MKKRMLAVLLSVLLITAMTGCGSLDMLVCMGCDPIPRNPIIST